MIEIGQRYQIEFIGRSGDREIFSGRIIGVDGALIQIATESGVRLLNMLSSAFVRARWIGDDPAFDDGDEPETS